MPETALIALYSIIVLLVLILVALVRVGSKLGGIARRLTPAEFTPLEKDSAPESGRDGAFAKFLGERPELLVLKKSEQFAAFRKWRKEQGLNWEGK